jgi:transcriptional regulator with XRE-family HTH domain
MKTLRVGTGKTQVEVSSVSGLAQSEVSRIEGRESIEELQLSTIRRYIEAIGGSLDLVVTFPTGHRAKLAGGGPKIEKD